MSAGATRPTALITGANRGIGKEVARQLGTRGYLVLIGARDLERGAQLSIPTPGSDASFTSDLLHGSRVVVASAGEDA